MDCASSDQRRYSPIVSTTFPSRSRMVDGVTTRRSAGARARSAACWTNFVTAHRSLDFSQRELAAADGRRELPHHKRKLLTDA
jgi:hypothetical protein